MLDRLFPQPGIKPEQCKQAYENPDIKDNIAPVDLVFEKGIIITDANRDIDRHPQYEKGDRCNKSFEKFSDPWFHLKMKNYLSIILYTLT